MQKTKERQQQVPNVHIAVENFGPIEKAEIDLRPLTVFVGESNTGKTYLAALIYALYQTFEGFDRVPWPYNVISQLRHSIFRIGREHDEATLKTLEKLNNREQPFKFSDLPEWLYVQIEEDLDDPELFASELKRCFNLNAVSELIQFAGSESNILKISLNVSKKNQPFWNFEMRASESDIAMSC